MNTKKGFTLIELLVVIAIIAILSAIGLVALNGAREKARDAQRRSDLGQIRTALSLYYDDNNSSFPAQTTAAADRDTNADAFCATQAGSNDYTYVPGGAYTADAADQNIFMSTGLIVPQYLGGQLVPPNGGTQENDCYHYDANEASTSAYTAYVLYTKLESGDGNWYYVDWAGNNGEDAADPVAWTDCVTDITGSLCSWTNG